MSRGPTHRPARCSGCATDDLSNLLRPDTGDLAQVQHGPILRRDARPPCQWLFERQSGARIGESLSHRLDAEDTVDQRGCVEERSIRSPGARRFGCLTRMQEGCSSCRNRTITGVRCTGVTGLTPTERKARAHHPTNHPSRPARRVVRSRKSMEGELCDDQDGTWLCSPRPHSWRRS